MLKLIKARLERAKGAWPELLGVLRAYRTPIGEMPFKLAFGTEVVIPIEVGLSSLRQAHYDEGSNNDKLRLSLDYLLKVRDETTLRMARYQQKMAKYHN